MTLFSACYFATGVPRGGNFCGAGGGPLMQQLSCGFYDPSLTWLRPKRLVDQAFNPFGGSV